MPLGLRHPPLHPVHSALPLPCLLATEEMWQGTFASKRSRLGAITKNPRRLWADLCPQPTLQAGLRRGWWNAGVMLPLSGEEWKGPGSGKRRNQQMGSYRHRPQSGNLGLRDPLSGPLRQPNQGQWISQSPELEERAEFLGLHCPLFHSPTQPLSCVPSHTPFLFSQARGGPLEAGMGWCDLKDGL